MHSAHKHMVGEHFSTQHQRPFLLRHPPTRHFLLLRFITSAKNLEMLHLHRYKVWSDLMEFQALNVFLNDEKGSKSG